MSRRRGRVAEPLESILSRRELRPYRNLVEAALGEGRLTREDVLTLARWRRWRAEKGLKGGAGADELLTWCRETRSDLRLQQLVSVLRRLDPASPDLRAAEAARLTRWRELHPAPGPSGKPRALQFSVPEDRLPALWRRRLEAMRAREPGPTLVSAPAPSIVTSIAQRLRQLVWSAEKAGLPLKIDRPQLKVWIADMEGRGLRRRTVASSLSKIVDYLLYAGDPAGVLEDLKRERAFQLARARGHKKKKDVFLEETGLSLGRIALAARDAYMLGTGLSTPREDDDEALKTALASAGTTRGRRMLCNDAALLALSLVMAPRLADLPRLILGETMIRLDDQWLVDLRTSKTGVDYVLPVDPRLTVLIDQAVLHGTDPAFVKPLYEARKGGALFVTDASNTPAGYAWATRHFHDIVGVGIHIVRSLWHDHSALRGPQGLEEALAVCGHVSPEARRHYQTAQGRKELMRSGMRLLKAVGEAALRERRADGSVR